MRTRPLRRWRRATQLLALLGVIWLFLQTDYQGQDELAFPVALLFRLDPLAALAAALAPGDFPWGLLWPALLLLALTVVLGRFFCGWLCPLGTTLDGCGALLGADNTTPRPRWRRVKYLLLSGLSAAALGGVQLLGVFDPLAIFLRTLTLSLFPAWNLALNGLFEHFYASQTPLVSPLLDWVYPFARDYLMAFHQPVFTLGLFTLGVFVAIALLERFERRFWCKNLCPLGALLGLCARHARLRHLPAPDCGHCEQCTAACASGATNRRHHQPSECLLCFDCAGHCPAAEVQLFWRRAPATAGIDLTRRGTVGALAAGVLLAPVVRSAPAQYRLEPLLLRPPGALAEEEFLRRCVRCGECLKVCIGAALHPALLQAGATGLWTPVVMPRIGYCEYNCTLCGQVCPTGAIRRLPLEEKRKVVIGLAVIEKDRCLPFARGEECLVCEEHCPTGEKAIVFEDKDVLVQGEVRRLKLPQVVKERCIGCGICETRCPLEGRSAIRIFNDKESRRVEQRWD